MSRSSSRCCALSPVCTVSVPSSTRRSRSAYEILSLADAQDSETMRVDGHLMIATGLAFTTDIEGGLERLEQGIRCFESQRHGSHRFQVGPNPGIATYTTAALILWLRGFPDRGLDHAQRAVALATELRHPITMAYALYHTGFVHLLRQEPEPMRERGVGVLDVADEYELPIWKALGTVLLGAARTDLGHHEEGLAQIQDGVAQYQGLRTRPCSGRCCSTCAHAPRRTPASRLRASTSSTSRSRSPAGWDPCAAFLLDEG